MKNGPALMDLLQQKIDPQTSESLPLVRSRKVTIKFEQKRSTRNGTSGAEHA